MLITAAGEMIPVNLELVNELWLPNIFIYNLKTFKVSLHHMGQFLQGGKNGRLMSFFFF